MDEQRVAGQLQDFYASGMGGAFIHSRSGLKTPYMEEKWFSCVQASIDTAIKAQRKVYLYDEDRYSSGFAGGEVCREHPEFRLRHLTVATAPDPEGETIAVFAVRRPSAELVSDYRRLAPGECAALGEETLWFQVCDFVGNPLWHNDSAPTDLCNKEAVERFIALAYESYADAYQAHFGDTIPAIFTDEVCMSVLPSGKRTEAVIANHHWTRDYPQLFLERFGYDFRQFLPELFFAVDQPRCPTLPRDYLCGLADLFEENFSCKLAQWCKEHHLAFTGHMNFAGFLDFTRVGNPLRHYYHWQWPGMDILTDQVAKLAAFKITASAAHQFGEGRVVCETYGCTGWDWPLERHRFHAGWQFCLGVNFRCQHLSHYTIAGWGKKDYPASISPHSPWFADYNQIEDYYARLSYALTRGKYAARTLVLSPYETVVSLYHGNHFANSDPALATLRQLNAAWERINRTLIEHHIDFDYGDEEMLCQMGICADGTVTLGEMTYDRVVVLPGHRLAAQTEHLLQKGGVEYICLADENIPGSLLAKLEGDCRITVAGENASDIWSTRRLDGDQTILFMQSMSKSEQSVTVTLSKTDNVLLLDEHSGALISLPVTARSDTVSVELSLLPEDNALLLCGYPQKGRPMPTPAPEKRLILPQGTYSYALSEPNTLPLDEVQIAFGDEAWSHPMSVSEAEEQIRARYGLPPQRFYESAQPWYIHRHQYASFNEICRMRYRFTVAQMPAQCCLAMEGYATFDCVTLNGNPLPAPEGYLIDPDLQTIDVASYLQTGKNTVELTFFYNTDIELENMILAGDFAVTAIHPAQPLTARNLQIAALPDRITGGSWAENGLPFYTGRVTYFYEWEDSGEACVLDLSGMMALSCVVTHNGQRMVKLCPPFVFDLSDSIKPGKNRLEIELCAGRKNLLGPLHVERPTIVEPDDFRFDSPYWQDRYMLHTFGLML